MDSYKEYIAAAVVRLISGKASEKEREDIRQWLSRYPELSQYNMEGQGDELLIDAYRNFVEIETQVKEETWTVVMDKLVAGGQLSIADVPGGKVVRVRRRRYISMAAAACILIIAGAGWYFGGFGVSKPGISVEKAAAGTPATLLPASQGAILTLADGSKVLLDSTGGGLLRRQGQVAVVKSGNGELKYLDPGGSPGRQLAFNKLTTPKGRQFRLELPDGSKVWLNAESSLEYPVAFTGGTREVKLEGEAYFEIAHDMQHPFFVKIPATAVRGGEDLMIRVLGTSFNAMAYGNEPKIQTTLLEGAVSLSRGKSVTRVQPGEAATIGRTPGEGFSVQKADVDRVMSWKNGMFSYNQASLSEIMRDIARWYDVDVRYEGAAPDLKFDGYISRSNPLNKILQILELNHVAFRMEGRTIVVSE